MIKHILFIGINPLLPFTTNKEILKDILESCLNDYSLIEIDGFWKGIREKSFMVIIITDSPLKSVSIKIVINQIKKILKQESILYIMDKKLDISFV